MLRLTRTQVREVDRLAVEKYHVPSIVLMENAARAVVDVALAMIPPAKRPTAHVICGGGNNGGDGLAVARHLFNRGVDVKVILGAQPARLRGDAEANWKIVQAMGIPWRTDDAKIAIDPADLIVDALFGTGLTEAPRDRRTIDLLNERPAPILAVDVPSGLDCDTGEAIGACVRATRTVTFVAQKAGFANPLSREFTGEVSVGDIGCPRQVIEEVLAQG